MPDKPVMLITGTRKGIGAHLAAPQRPSVCLTGDAGMAMVMGELGVVAQRQLPILIIVLNDGAIDLIRSQQVRAGKPVYGTVFESPNFSQTSLKLCEFSMDGWSQCVTSVPRPKSSPELRQRD